MKNVKDLREQALEEGSTKAAISFSPISSNMSAVHELSSKT